MAEPRKVQFVTLSAFAAGSATESSRKRRLEEEEEEDDDDVNFDEEDEDDDGEEEVEEVDAATAATAGAAGAAGGVAAVGNGRLDTRDNKADQARRKTTMRLNLSLREPSDHASAEFNYGELVKNIQKKNRSKPPIQDPPIQNPGLNSSDPFNDDERERLQVEALAKKFEDKYSNTGGKKKDRMQDLVDIGFGYDETDPFIDNSEAYDELVPASLTTKLGGFYINTGTLQFRPTSDTEGEEGAKILIREDDDDDDDDDGMVIKRRKKKEVNSLEEKKPRKNRVPKQGVLPLSLLHRPEKKKRKKLMKDSLCLAAMLRRFTREKEEMRKRNPNALHTSLVNNPHSAASTNALAANSSHLHGNAANSDVSLADLTSDPAMVSLLGSASEKELQDLLGDLDFSLLDSHSGPHHVMATARENGLLGVGVPANKAAAGGAGQARGLGASSGHFSPLPDGLPAPLIKRIEDLRTASRQFDQEGRKKFFTLDMNNILLDIELQVQEQPQDVRSAIYSHMEAFVPCNKEALLKRLKKLSLNIQDDRLRTPLLKLKLAVCSVMPEQIARYNMDCMAKAAKHQTEEGEKNGSEEDDEEKPGKRVMGPRKKFVWDDKLRSLLCSLVRVKLSCYELEINQCSLTVEEYLKAFMENEVKPLWPKGWMQARILLKESRVVHAHLTGNLVKRRMVPGPKAKAKDAPWILRPPLSMGTSLMPQRPISSPSEPICLSDSLDEDLTAPSLDSISHALALFGGGSSSKGAVGHSDSPLSPPPLQMPASSPPSVAPHYASSSSMTTQQPPSTSSSATSSAQHSLVSRTESVPPAGAPTPTPPSAVSTSSPSSSAALTSASMARLQMAGSSSSSLSSRPVDVGYGLAKGQNQRHITALTPTHRPGSAALLLGGSSSRLHPQPSPSPPKQRPPPTSSPLLPPHQKGFANSSQVASSSSNNPHHGLAKNGANKAGVVVSVSSSNGSAMSCGVPTSRSSSHSHLQTFSPVAAAHSQAKAHPLPGQQQQTPQQQHQHHHHHPLHQANFITPMQATLTKSSHSSGASPIIKLTPRPPAPTPPSSSSSSSPSPCSSPSHSLSHQYSNSSAAAAKSPGGGGGFRPPFSQAGKQQQSNYSFTGGQKAQSMASSSVNNGSSSSSNHSMGGGVVSSNRQELTPSPSSSVSSANHGQRQRTSTGGGAGQGSNKVGGGGRASSSGTLSTTSSATSHLAQVSSAGSALLGNPAALPLSFGMLGGLVPVTLPFQFPSLLNFNAPGAPGVGSMGTAAGANSGYSLSPNELMDLYKSLQSGAQAALPPHLQLAFSDANQSQGGDMKRKSH